MERAPVPDATCSICGDPEPSHVHLQEHRIDDYFTVGRGQTDFQAALMWQQRYTALKRALHERLYQAVLNHWIVYDPKEKSGFRGGPFSMDGRQMTDELIAAVEDGL